MHLILPKTLPNLEPYTHLPLFFLMGPLLRAGEVKSAATVGMARG